MSDKAGSPLPPKGRAVRVRCLGPKRAEHSFWSLDPRGNRVCPDCQRRQRELNLSSRQLEVPTPTPDD